MNLEEKNKVIVVGGSVKGMIEPLMRLNHSEVIIPKAAYNRSKLVIESRLKR